MSIQFKHYSFSPPVRHAAEMATAKKKNMNNMHDANTMSGNEDDDDEDYSSDEEDMHDKMLKSKNQIMSNSLRMTPS